MTHTKWLLSYYWCRRDSKSKKRRIKKGKESWSHAGQYWWQMWPPDHSETRMAFPQDKTIYFWNFDVSALQKYVGRCVHLICRCQSWGWTIKSILRWWLALFIWDLFQLHFCCQWWNMSTSGAVQCKQTRCYDVSPLNWGAKVMLCGCKSVLSSF